MSLSFTPNLSPKLSAPATNPAISSSLRKDGKDELNASGVNVLIPEKAREEASKTKSSGSIANSAVKKNLSSSKSSAQTSSKGTQVADASNSTSVPNSGTDGDSRFGDLVKNGGHGLQTEIDKSRADTKEKIGGDTKDPASETNSGGGSGGAGAYSLPGTGAGTAIGPGANSGPNFGTINNNFGNQNIGGNQSLDGVQNNDPFINMPNVTTPPASPEVAVPQMELTPTGVNLDQPYSDSQDF